MPISDPRFIKRKKKNRTLIYDRCLTCRHRIFDSRHCVHYSPHSVKCSRQNLHLQNTIYFTSTLYHIENSKVSKPTLFASNSSNRFYTIKILKNLILSLIVTCNVRNSISYDRTGNYIRYNQQTDPLTGLKLSILVHTITIGPSSG